MITAFFLYSNNKNLEKIQQIIIFIKIANFAKYIISYKVDFEIIITKNQLISNNTQNQIKNTFIMVKKTLYKRLLLRAKKKSKKEKIEKKIKQAQQ